MRWTIGIAAILCCAPLAAAAQMGSEPPAVQWQLEVVSDGATIDRFDGKTALGQAATSTHHHEIVNEAGCLKQPAARIDLARTLTVSPVASDERGITLAIDAQETIEDDQEQRTRDGCKLPPTPRRVTANHPGLIVAAGQTASWTIVDAHPTLVYRVRASVGHGQD